MQNHMRLRQILGAVGAFSGLALWGLFKILETSVLNDRTALTLASFVSATLGAHMALSGALTQKQAIARALLLGAGISLLTTLAAFRYDEVYDLRPMSGVFLVLIWHVGLPFMICHGLGRGLRDYPTLYAESWKLFERLTAAWIFAGLTWAVIYLSDLVLGLVGLQILQTIYDVEPLGPMITGAALGLGLAVMLEIGGAVVPALLQRLLRLLLPVLLAVVVIFLVILPFRSFDSVFGNLSAGTIFLVLVAMMATMVTAAIGPHKGEEVQLRLMQQATRAMAVLMPLPTALAFWALWLRVGQYGWTPERLAAGLLVALALLSAGLYVVAALRPGWHEAIRRGNVIVALAGILSAALWVGILPTERISANGLLARSATLGPIDINALQNWGKPGARVLAELQAKADAGDAMLAAVLNGDVAPVDPEILTTQRQALKALLPVQPATATATRDAFLDLAAPDMVQIWSAACQPPDAPPPASQCGVIVADFLTDATGEEVLFLQKDDYGLQISGFSFGPDGVQSHSAVAGAMMGYLYSDPESDLFARLMASPPSLMPAPMNVIPLGGGIMFMPDIPDAAP